MERKELKLGQALALLEAEHDDAPFIQRPQLPPHEDDALSALRQRWQALASQPDISQELLQGVPEHGCQMEPHFLAGNEDFFVTCIQIALSSKVSHGSCSHLFKHLNDCFLCFEEFSNVMRDYYHMLAVLGRATNGIKEA